MSDAGLPQRRELNASRIEQVAPGNPRSVEFGDKEQYHARETESRPAKPALAGSSLAQPRTGQAQTASQAAHPSALHRAAGMARAVLPLLQKVLPLIDGNIASAVSNILLPAGPRVNLGPVENALEKLHAGHLELHGTIMEQTAELKHIAEQLDLVKSATGRNALEQKEQAEDLSRLRRKVSFLGWVGLGLLAVSIAMNIALFIRMEQMVR